MGLFSWLFGSEESRNEAKLRKRAAEIEKELAALEPQIKADRERMTKAARSPRDADLANLLIAQVNEELGLAPRGSSGMSVWSKANDLEKELVEIRRQLDEIGKNCAAAPPATQPSQLKNATGRKETDRFARYTGSGVCDVCNKNLISGAAYRVPKDVFWSSKKYRQWLASGPFSSLMREVGGVDVHIREGRAMDASTHSVVCSVCVDLFK